MMSDEYRHAVIFIIHHASIHHFFKDPFAIARGCGSPRVA
jgi:hypothetical protein